MRLVSTIPEHVPDTTGITGPHRRGGKRWTTEDPPKKIRDFVQWFAHERTYGEGMRDYAARCGFSEVMIAKWRKDPRVMTLLEAELQGTNAGPLKVQEVLDMLHRRATQEEDVKAAGMYLQAVGRMMPKRTEVDVRITDTRGLSNEELHAELRRAITLIEDQAGLPAGDVEEAVVVSDTADPGLGDG